MSNVQIEHYIVRICLAIVICINMILLYVWCWTKFRTDLVFLLVRVFEELVSRDWHDWFICIKCNCLVACFYLKVTLYVTAKKYYFSNASFIFQSSKILLLIVLYITGLALEVCLARERLKISEEFFQAPCSVYSLFCGRNSCSVFGLYNLTKHSHKNHRYKTSGICRVQKIQ